jgi:hypothetical protein
VDVVALERRRRSRRQRINCKLLQNVSSKRLLDSKRDVSNIMKCHLVDDKPSAYTFAPPAVFVFAVHEW